MKIAQIDVFADIIDNYGDMGWVLEFLLESHISTSFRIVTDDPMKMHTFLEKSECSLPPYELIEKKNYDYAGASSLIILGLHASVEFESFPLGTGVIRISYLTFDPWYRDSHTREHIFSRPDRPIIELVSSPLTQTGGVWYYENSRTTREKWLKKMSLPENLASKIWIPIFAYRETLAHLNLHDIPENVHIFFIGEISPYAPTPPLSDSPTIGLPHSSWLPRDTFWELIDLSDISLLRGEISSIRGLMSEKPYIWDMYKGISGWNKDESDTFLDYIEASKQYREIHDKINSGESWNISDILLGKKEWKRIDIGKIPSFRESLKKTIDKMGFSL